MASTHPFLDSVVAVATAAETKAAAAQTKAASATEAATAAPTAALTAAVNAMNTARATDSQANPPRLRVSFNTAAPLVLTTAWQPVAFKKTGTYDVDTFPTPRYEATTNRLVAATGDTIDRQYDVEFFYKFTTGLPPIYDVQLRFVVPRPAASGGPIYFPFPDGDGFTDVGSLLKSPQRGTYKQILYFNQLVRDYGIRLEMRTESAISIVLNRPTLVDAALSLFPR